MGPPKGKAGQGHWLAIKQVGAASLDRPSAKCLSSRKNSVVGPGTHSDHPMYITVPFREGESFRFMQREASNAAGASLIKGKK